MRAKTSATLFAPSPAQAKINGAIRDLQAAKRFLARRKLERAEDALANSLPDIAGAILAINRQERKRRIGR